MGKFGLFCILWDADAVVCIISPGRYARCIACGRSGCSVPVAKFSIGKREAHWACHGVISELDGMRSISPRFRAR